MDHAVTVLEYLRQTPVSSRVALGRGTGLSPATISRAIAKLKREGMVAERSEPPAGVGRPARVVELLSRAAYVLGIDVGGSRVRAVLVDLEGMVHASEEGPLVGNAHEADVIGQIAAVALRAGRAAGPRPILAASAGISGIVDRESGTVLLSPDIPSLTRHPVRDLLAAALGVAVAIDNDDVLAAVGEATAGAAMGCRDVVFLSLGYGLGAGLIVSGRPARGHGSSAGAIAYLAPGPLEERASGRVIPQLYATARARTAAAGMEPGGGSPTARATTAAAGTDVGATTGAGTDVGAGSTAARQAVGPPLEARDIFRLAAADDPVAAAVVEGVVQALGDLAVNVAALLNPEVIVLGGGLSRNGPQLVEPIRRLVATHIPFPPRVVVSELDDLAVARGAAHFALSLAKQRLAGQVAGQSALIPDPARVGSLQLL